MAPRLSKQVPCWFNLVDYKIAREFNRHDWAKMLRWRRSWSDAWTAAESDECYDGLIVCKPKAEEFWNAYLIDALPSRLDRPQVQSDEKSPVLDITHDFSARRFRARYKWSIELEGCRMLLVDPGACDATLREQFSSWLIDQREKANIPSRRGPKAANFEITSRLLRSWADDKLLPVWDLDFYAEVFGLSKLNPEALCDAVDVNVTGAKDWARATRNKTVGLLKYIDYLPR